MSLPKSRILSTSKGLTAAAEFHNNSPEQNTVVNVNVHSNESSRTSSEIITTDTQPQPQAQAQAQIQAQIQPPSVNPYAVIDSGTVSYPPIQEISPKSGVITPRSDSKNQESVDELQAVIHSKDNIINALSLMVDIMESNPLIVNKYVIADLDSLTLLIQYLTEAERVDIQEGLDVDCSCIGCPKYTPVDKIYITKNGETQNFKYQYPNANKVLDDHHISVKFVVESKAEA